MTKYTLEITNVISSDILRVEEYATLADAVLNRDSYNLNNDMDCVFVAVLREVGPTAFQRVAEMNEAFGNPKGDADSIDWQRIRSQCKNVFDEYCELMTALGLSERDVGDLKDAHAQLDNDFPNPPDVEAVRDALCDIQVFDMGAQHLMGYDGDNDMDDVIDGVMSRFIKDASDKQATEAMHRAKGVTEVYFEGEYPKMVMKSATDQPDAPQGKFLKSASYRNTVFRPAHG